MKTLLMTLLAASAATTLVMADDQLPTTSTRKQGLNAGEKSYTSEDGALKSEGRVDTTRTTRKQGLDAGTPFFAPGSKTMRDENKAEDHNREDTLRQLRPDGAADAPSR